MKPLHLGYDALNHPISLDTEQRKGHMHVIGASGSGKSKLLEWMIRSDLKNGQGFALVDPHGTLYHDVMRYCAHRVHEGDLIPLNLSAPDSIVGFNPFQKASLASVSVQVDRRIAATMHAWNVESTDQTPTLERTLRLIYTVMLDQNLALPHIQHLIDFNARDFRRAVVDRLQTSLIQKEWRELQQLKAKEWRDEILSAKNRLFRFLTSPALTRFMGLPDRTLDLKAIMDEGKVVLVNLAPSDELSEENARVFGALLVNEFFECARRRQKDSRGGDPRPYYLYMDEFQNFVSLDIADMLDQVRKFGLFAVLAHQRFGQLDDNLIDAVLTNCAIKACFGGLPVTSARMMAEELFIGELDAKKIKMAIYQTKFWPEYRRDKVYSTGTSHTSAASTSHHAANGSFNGTSAAASFFMPDDWFAGMAPSGRTKGSSSGESAMTSASDAESDAWGESEAVADVPIFFPVPFKELSSVQYYTPEEQLTELTAALKEQFPRHCFIKISGQKTQPMLVPFVEPIQSFQHNQENLDWYRTWQLARQGALPAAEVDRRLDALQRVLPMALPHSAPSFSVETSSPYQPPAAAVELTPKPSPLQGDPPSALDPAKDDPFGWG